MPAGQALRAMQAVLEMPDDAVAQFQARGFEHRIERDIQGNDLAIVDVIADLPADRAARMQEAHAFVDDVGLRFDVALEARSALVALADIIGRRGDDQLHAVRAEIAHEIEIVGAFQNRRGRGYAAGWADARGGSRALR